MSQAVPANGLSEIELLRSELKKCGDDARGVLRDALAEIERLTIQCDKHAASLDLRKKQIERLDAEIERLREALGWLRMAMGWAVFRDDSRVWASNEMRDIKERIAAALGSSYTPGEES